MDIKDIGSKPSSPVAPSGRPQKTPQDPQVEPGRDGDSVEVSKGARDFVTALEMAETLKEMPDVRDEIIREAEAALESGKLLDDDVAREAATKLLRDLKKP